MFMRTTIKIIYISIAVLTGFGFCGCAEELSREREPQIELRLQAVNQPALSRGLTTDDIQNTLFIAGQTINSYSTITGATDGVTTWGNPLLLEAKTAENGVNPMETTDGTKLYFPPGENVSATIDAVYPSSVNKSVTTFTVASTQTSDDAYKASDLMFASVTTPKTDQPVHLQFAHQMAKLVVNATGTDGLTIKSIKLLKIFQQVQFDPSNTPWQLKDNTLGAQGALVMASNGDSYTETLSGAALFPPQTYSETDFMDIDVKTKDGNTGTAHFLIESKAFEGGKVYTINVKIGEKNLQEGEAGQVVIAPWPASVGTVNVQAVGNLGLKVESLADDNVATTNTLQGSGNDIYYTYNGKMCTPVPTVSDGKEEDATTLRASTDYDVTYYNNLNAGTAIIVVNGKGEYEGLSTFTTFQIKKAANTMSYPNSNAAFNSNLSRDGIVQNKLVLPSYESNRPATQKSEVYGNMTFKLYSDAGYTTEYSPSEAERIATIDEYGNVYMKKKGGPIYVKATMDDTGNFEAGEAHYALTITAGDVAQVISIEWTGDNGNSFVYTGSVIQPTNFAIKDNGNTLAKGYDYTVTYGTGANQTNVCTEAQQKACVIITGQNEYSGTKTFYFNITKATNTWTKLNKPSVALGTAVSKTSPQGDAGDIGTLSLPAQTFNTAGSAKFGSVSFTSSNTGVATVSNTGIITAVAKGSANITASVTGTDNYTGLSETIAVTVEEKNRIFIYNGNTTTSGSTYWQTTGGSAQECKITFAKAATVQVAVVGAGGGNDGDGRGGVGGCVVASKHFDASSVTWYVFCGGGGWSGGGSATATAENGKGGWPGGGRPGTTGSSGAGGGATALCTTNSTDNWDYTDTDSRMLVAGGGGGSSNGGNGGEDAGALPADQTTGTSPLNPGSMYHYAGTAKKKWMGGFAGTDYEGESYKDNPTADGGAGGAGYYGGMGGSEVNSGTTIAAGGHGGSNFIKSDWTMAYNGISGILLNRATIKYLGFTIPYNGQKGSTNSYRVYPGFVFLRYIYDVETTEAGWPLRDDDGFETTTYRQ